MRIIQVIAAFQLGGAETVAGNLTLGLASRGHQVLVAAVRVPTEPDPVGQSLRSKLEVAGIETRQPSVGLKTVETILGPVRLAALYKRWNADMIHSHTDVPDFAVSLASRLNRDMRVARTIHNTELWASHPRLGRITESGLTDDLIIHISDATREAYGSLRKRYGLAPSPWQLLIKSGLALDDALPPCDRSHLVERYGADPNRRQLCFAGRITSQKGVDTLVEAVSQMEDAELSRFQLHIFGDGDERETISNLVRQRRLPIVIHRPEPDIYRLFPAFDCLVLPSRFEGLALVALESLSQGVPIIVTAVPGLREAVPDWWPLVVAPEDARGLARTIGKVIALPDGSMGDLGLLAREWAKREYSYDRMVDRYEQAFTHLCEGRLSQLDFERSQ